MTLTLLSQRFWEKVQITGSCWTWTAATQNGYGIFWNPTVKQNVKAHRFAYEDLVGPIPAGLTIDHVCRVRSCVNPDHLDPVPMSVNNARSAGHRMRRDACPQGHPYEIHGRIQDGYFVCRECDNQRHRAARKGNV